MTKTITIKMYEGVKLTCRDRTEFFEGPRDIWDAFGWDIDNDETAADCAREVTRCLIGLGYCDLKDNDGDTIHLEVVPCK